MKNSQKGLTKVIALFAILFVALTTMFPVNVMAKETAKEDADTYVKATQTLSITDNVIARSDDTYRISGTTQVEAIELEEEYKKPIDVVFVLDNSRSMLWDLTGKDESTTGSTSRLKVVKENAITLANKVLAQNADNRVAAVKFGRSSSHAAPIQAFTNDGNEFSSSVKTGLKGDGDGTYLGSGIKVAESILKNDDKSSEDRVRLVVAITDGQDNSGTNTLADFKAIATDGTNAIYRLIGLGFEDDKQVEGANKLNSYKEAAKASFDIDVKFTPLDGSVLADVLDQVFIDVSKAAVKFTEVNVAVPANFDFVEGSIVVTDKDGLPVSIVEVSDDESEYKTFVIERPTSQTYNFAYDVKINQAESAKLSQADFKVTDFNHKIKYGYEYGSTIDSLEITDTVAAKTHKITVNSCENSTISNTYDSTEYYVGNGASHGATWAPKTKDDKLQSLVVTTYPVEGKEVANTIDTKTLTEDAYALENIQECTNIYVSYVKELPSIDVKPTPKEDKVVGLPSVATGQNMTALVATLVAVAGASLYLAYRLNRYRKSL